MRTSTTGACPRWQRAVTEGRVLLASASGRLVLRSPTGLRIVTRCPFCDETLYRATGGHDVLTPAGHRHRRIAVAFLSGSSRSEPEDPRAGPSRAGERSSKPTGAHAALAGGKRQVSADDDDDGDGNGCRRGSPLPVHSIMSSPVIAVSPNEPVTVAAARLEVNRIGALPVVEQGRPVGIVTCRDIACRVVACCLDGGTPVSLVMTCAPATLPTSAMDVDAARLMRDRAIRRVLVVNERNRLVGIVTFTDVVTWSSDALRARLLRGLIQPRRSSR